MARLPLIVGFGGINAAGRSSGFHGYKRMVAGSLSPHHMAPTWQDLGRRMGLLAPGETVTPAGIDAIEAGTLVRRIESFDPDHVTSHHWAAFADDTQGHAMLVREQAATRHGAHGPQRGVTLDGKAKVLLPLPVASPVGSGANLPRGFDPARLYPSLHHPRTLQLTVYAASDMLRSLGMEWEAIMRRIEPDQVAVYAGSSFSSMDESSLTGLIGQPLRGGRVSAKMLPLSMPQMPADFINGYILNSVGTTGTSMGACASFLYNLRQGVLDIQSGKARVVVVGSSEAPLTPEFVNGFAAMGALAEDRALRQLDGTDAVDHRRACRPFSTNVGFTLGEAAQLLVLMDDALALELGASIHGAVADVFVNADGNKKSIVAPGVGNVITMAKATALARAILGEEGLRQTYVQAHGTGTPVNRVTESHVINEVAKTFGIARWPVTAIKSYVGHTLAAAAGDQVMASLGVWKYGWVPGIKTIDHVAEDVSRSHLEILREDWFGGEAGEQIKAAIINSKGFGGNNASALLLSPQQTVRMLGTRHGAQALAAWRDRNTEVARRAAEADEEAVRGNETVIYHAGTEMMDQDALTMTPDHLVLPGMAARIDLDMRGAYRDYL